MMFSVQNLCAGYHPGSSVLRDVSFSVAKGEVLCLLGRNGAGKTSTLKAIMGLLSFRSGKITLDNEDISDLKPHEIPLAGIGYVPQGRRLFPELSVRENLEIGALTQPGHDPEFERLLALFPALASRMEQQSGTLSGGEQQMLAIARALCVEPKLLILDEPTEGLMPAMISTIRKVISELSGTGVSILLVEQRVDAVLVVADKVSFMDTGKLMETMPASEIKQNENLVRHYIGVG